MRSVAALAIAVIFSGYAAQAAMPTKLGEGPVMLEAETIGYDTKESEALASGNVQVVQGDLVLFADHLRYDQKTRMVRAESNVSLLDAEGNVYFAESMELKDDLKTGVITNFRARLKDNSLFAAREARRLSDKVLELVQAVYSPCKICKDEDGKPGDPLWQLKAEKVTLDDDKQTISYNNAFFEVYGVPIFYTPYFSHGTPNADNKTGLLLPEFSNSGTLGSAFSFPYYISLAPDKDLTLTPILTTKEGPVLAGEYRQITETGSYYFDGSITNPTKRDASGAEIDGHELRGHIKGGGGFQLTDIIDWGFEVNRVTDDTYLRRYNFSYEDSLTSRVFIEALDFLRGNGRSWAVAQALTFQGLKVTDESDTTPLVAPVIDAFYESDPGWAGGRFSLSGNAMVLARQEGADSRRLSLTGGWRLPYVTDSGHIFETAFHLRGDVYSVEDVATSSGDFSGGVSRLIPQASFGWRYPLIKALDGASLVIEPQANVIISSNGNNPEEIPNEDSLSQEFSDSNLFDTHRFTGLDTVENGTRANYGVRAQVQTDSGNNVNLLLGQVYSDNTDNRFPLNTQMGRHQSDYVGRIGVSVAPVELAYRFQLDQEDFAVKRNEVSATYMLKPVSASLHYIELNDDPVLGNRREVAASVGFELNQNWTFTAAARRDLRDEFDPVTMQQRGGMLSAGAGLLYQNECVSVLTGVNRNFTRDRDALPSTSVSVRVSLKNVN